MSITTTPMSPQKELEAARVIIQQQQERIEQLEADYARLNDFEQTQSAKLLKLLMKLAERDKQLEAMTKLIAYCDSCTHFGDRTPDGMGACMKDPKCWKHVSPDDYRPECFEWRNAGMEGE